MMTLGITGGIGSGKSMVASIFEHMGFAIYSADARAKWLMNHDAELKSQIRNLFGEEAYAIDGTLNRAYISSQAFTQPEVLRQLNALVHPATGRDFIAWKTQQSEASSQPFCLKEAAILFESGAWKETDYTLTVYAPRSLRLSRVTQRDRTDTAIVSQRMENQWPELAKIQRTDFVIFNDGVHLLLPQVRNAIRYFQGKSTPG